MEDTSPAQAETRVPPDLEKLTKTFKAGANWFYWIAGLSLVNSLIILFEGQWSFVVGLGITQVFDAIAAAIAQEAEGGVAQIVKILALALNILVAMVFVLFGWLAGKRYGWAFIVGMVLYFLDGLIFLLVQDWMSLAFHAFALFCIFGGYSSLKKLRQIEAIAGASAASPTVEAMPADSQPSTGAYEEE